MFKVTPERSVFIIPVGTFALVKKHFTFFKNHNNNTDQRLRKI